MTPTPIALCMLAKAPVPGQVKTRLTPPLSPSQASQLHRAFLHDLGRRLATVRRDARQEVALYLSVSGPLDHPAFAPLLAPLMGFVPLAQQGADLGEKMTHLATELFTVYGASQVVLIGSDSPTMPARLLHQALHSLQTHDVVLGPSFDGGYYLVGLGQGRAVSIFEGIPWSTEAVFATTWRRGQALGLRAHALEFWYDVDTPQDLRHLRRHLLDCLAPGQEHEYTETLKALSGLRGLLDPHAPADDPPLS